MTKTKMTELVKLLVEYHNSVTVAGASLNGDRMDKALCADTLTTLARHIDWNEFSAIRAGLNQNDISNVPAAACNNCGGWTEMGGMSQYSKAYNPNYRTERHNGRTGCTCT